MNGTITSIFATLLFLITQLSNFVKTQGEGTFEEFGFLEMNKLNSEALFKSHEYMLALVTEDKDCQTEDCKEGIELILKSIASANEKIQVQPVWINSKDNKLLVKKLRIVEGESIVYLANGRAVVYQEDWEQDELTLWLKKRAIMPSTGFSKYDELDPMKNEHDLVVIYGGIRNQYYRMFRYVASTYNDLHFAHSFSAPVRNFPHFYHILPNFA
jgi:hypothetical protein